MKYVILFQESDLLKLLRLHLKMSKSFAPECTELKQNYDSCFNQWYTEKFLAGKKISNECSEKWKEYKTCVDAALVKKGMMSMLKDAREEASFEDGGIPNMGRK